MRYGDALVGHWAAEDEGHLAVANHHAYERQQEAEARQSHAVRIVVYRVPWRAQIVAHGAVALLPCCCKVESWHTQGANHQPYQSADAPHYLATALLVPHRERVANGQITLHTDAGQEQDAAVEITVTETQRRKCC